jgi:hypothetical protein
MAGIPAAAIKKTPATQRDDAGCCLSVTGAPDGHQTLGKDEVKERRAAGGQ